MEIKTDSKEETLDFNKAIFKKLLEQTTELILNQFQGLDKSKGYHDFPQQEVED